MCLIGTVFLKHPFLEDFCMFLRMFQRNRRECFWNYFRTLDGVKTCRLLQQPGFLNTGERSSARWENGATVQSPQEGIPRATNTSATSLSFTQQLTSFCIETALLCRKNVGNFWGEKQGSVFPISFKSTQAKLISLALPIEHVLNTCFSQVVSSLFLCTLGEK